MPLYFAYGANMDVSAMKGRCPASRPLGRGLLHGYSFFVSGNGYGSIRRKAGTAVSGLVWDLAEKDLPALDRYEAVAAGLYAKLTLPILFRDRTRPALAYIARCARSGKAMTGYMEAVVDAAELLGLPEPHLRELRRWLPETG